MSYLRIQKKFNFPIYRYHLSLVQITQFQHGFRMLWGQTTFLYIVDCHSATFWSTKSCHTPDERALPEVSYEVKTNDLLHEVAEIWTSELFKYFSPRTWESLCYVKEDIKILGTCTVSISHVCLAVQVGTITKLNCVPQRKYCAVYRLTK